MMPPNVSFVVPSHGGVATEGTVEIHGHSLHILDDDALNLMEQPSGRKVDCPTKMETFDEGDLTSDQPGSFQVRCVLTIDVSLLPNGSYALQLNLLSGIHSSGFEVRHT